MFLNPNNFFPIWILIVLIHHKWKTSRNKLKKHSVTKKCLNNLYKWSHTSFQNVFLDHKRHFFSQYIRTILVKKNTNFNQFSTVSQAQEHNCFAFVLAFLRSLKQNPLSMHANNKVDFCTHYVLPKTIQGISYWNGHYKLALTDINMQLDFNWRWFWILKPPSNKI